MPEFTEETIMPFGLHKGKKLKDIPPGYFIYLNGKPYIFGWLKIYIDKNLVKFRQRVREEIELLR